MTTPKTKKASGKRTGVVPAKRHDASTREAATRDRILRTALDVFSRVGFKGASIAEIAQRGHVSPPLIHYYFKTKTEVWRAAIDAGIGGVIADLQLSLKDLHEVSPISKLKFFVRRYINLMAERPDVFLLIVRESESPGPRLTWLSATHLAPLYRTINTLIEEAQASGALKSIAPPYHVAQVIIGACYHFIASRTRMQEAYGIDTHVPEIRDRHAALVIEALFSGLETRPEPTRT